MGVGCIQGDQYGIEIEPAHGFEQDGRIVMPGKSQVFHAPLLACLDERFKRAAAAEDHLQVARGAQVVKLPQVEVIGARSLEALVEKPERSVAGAVMGLRGQKNLAAALAQGGTVVVETAGIGRGRIAVGHPLVECAVDDGDGLAHAAVGAKHSFAAQGKLGHLLARAAQKTARNRPGGTPPAPE